MKKFTRIVVMTFLIMIITVMTGCDWKHKDFFANENTTNEAIMDLGAHANENGYAEFIDYMENELSKEEYEEIMTLLDGHYINNGLYTLKYSSVSGTSSYCYINGTYTIPYNVKNTVQWSKNVTIDIYNNNFNCNRHYTVSDSSQIAYMLIGGSKFGYQVIRIVPDASELAISEIDYTKDGFDNLCHYIENQKHQCLTELLNNQTVTAEILGNLYKNEYDWECVYEYVGKISDSKKDEIMKEFFEGKNIDGIVTIQINRTSGGYYYSYEDNVYHINPNFYFSVKWTQNVEKILDEENADVSYKVKDTEVDAYILLWTKNGYELVRFVSEDA